MSYCGPKFVRVTAVSSMCQPGRPPPPRAVPLPLLQDDGAPQRKVQEVPLVRGELQRPQRQLALGLVRELPVVRVLGGVKVDDAVGEVRVSVLDQDGDLVDHHLDVVGDALELVTDCTFKARMSSRNDCGVLVGDLAGLHPLALGGLGYPVIHVGDVHQEVHAGAEVSQVPREHVVEDVRPRVAPHG